MTPPFFFFFVSVCCWFLVPFPYFFVSGLVTPSCLIHCALTADMLARIEKIVNYPSCEKFHLAVPQNWVQIWRNFGVHVDLRSIKQLWQWGAHSKANTNKLSVGGVCCVYARALHPNPAGMSHHFVCLHSKQIVFCIFGLNGVAPVRKEWRHAYISVRACFVCASMCGINECCTLSVWGMKMS